MQEIERSKEKHSAPALSAKSGQPTKQQSKKTFTIKNPATGLEIDAYPLMSREDVDQTVAKARQAFNAWSQTSFTQRKAFILRATHYLAENAPLFAEQVAAENGKTKADALFEIGSAIDCLRYAATHAQKALRPRKHISFTQAGEGRVPAISRQIFKKPGHAG